MAGTTVRDSEMLPGFIEHYPDGVPLHSGGTSHYLVRGDLLFADERVREQVLSRWYARMCAHLNPSEVFVYGIPTGGTPWAEAFAHRFGLSLVQTMDGYDAENLPPVIIIDDVVTTGRSISEAAQKFEAKYAFVVVDRRSHVAAGWTEMTFS